MRDIQPLIEYIQESRKAGLSDDSIQSTILQDGDWTKEEFDSATRHVIPLQKETSQKTTEQTNRYKKVFVGATLLFITIVISILIFLNQSSFGGKLNINTDSKEFYSSIINKNKGKILVSYKNTTSQEQINSLMSRNPEIRGIISDKWVPYWVPHGRFKYYELTYGDTYKRPSYDFVKQTFDDLRNSNFIERVSFYREDEYPNESSRTYHLRVIHNLNSLDELAKALEKIAPHLTVVPRHLLEYNPQTDAEFYLPEGYKSDDQIKLNDDGHFGYDEWNHLKDDEAILLFGLKEEVNQLDSLYQSKEPAFTFVRFFRDDSTPEINFSIARIGFLDELDFDPVNYIKSKLPSMVIRNDDQNQTSVRVVEYSVEEGKELQLAAKLRSEDGVNTATFFQEEDFPLKGNDSDHNGLKIMADEEGIEYMSNTLIIAFTDNTNLDMMAQLLRENNLEYLSRSRTNRWLVTTNDLTYRELKNLSKELNKLEIVRYARLNSVCHKDCFF